MNAHKQDRVAGENALGGNRQFAGSLGTQVVKIFDQAARTAGCTPATWAGSVTTATSTWSADAAT